ncbi:MAG: hypothetical protein ACXABG_11440 [Promethearchaeota archaeon]|jgi:hypothetical protein
MVDWEQIAEQALYYWEEFMNWFLGIPIYGQVLVIIGALAALVLAVIIVYYVLKGTAYLVYYILKGVYLLIRGIFTGIYKLFEELYYAISGKPKPVKQASDKKCCEPPEPSQQTYEEQEILVPAQREIQVIQLDAVYCSECGTQYTERMLEQLKLNGIAYCVYCGKGYKSNKAAVEQY